MSEFDILPDGVHYEYAIGEYVIIVNGDIAGYAEQQQMAWAKYNTALRLQREHVTRNPANIEYTQQEFYGVNR